MNAKVIRAKVTPDNGPHGFECCYCAEPLLPGDTVYWTDGYESAYCSKGCASRDGHCPHGVDYRSPCDRCNYEHGNA